MDKTKKASRKEQILQALALMLETAPGERVTTATLAKKVGVSEAALYRHFPSKAKMFEGLIEFIEESLFSRISLILQEYQLAHQRCEIMLHFILGFSEMNPGLTRLLTGDVLAGETEQLRRRVFKLFERLETQLKQILREAETQEGLRTQMPAGTTANLILALVEGRICQYVRTEFTKKPTDLWADQWKALASVIFRT